MRCLLSLLCNITIAVCAQILDAIEHPLPDPLLSPDFQAWSDEMYEFDPQED